MEITFYRDYSTNTFKYLIALTKQELDSLQNGGIINREVYEANGVIAGNLSGLAKSGEIIVTAAKDYSDA